MTITRLLGHKLYEFVYIRNLPMVFLGWLQHLQRRLPPLHVALLNPEKTMLKVENNHFAALSYVIGNKSVKK
jgi:hypothetical protein